MKNIKFSRLFAAVTFVAILVLAGCKQPEDETKGSIYGTWLDSSWGKSYYTITDSSFKNYGERPDGSSYDGYTGSDLVVDKVSDTDGYIYIKYLTSYEVEYSEPTAENKDSWTRQSYESDGETYYYWERYSSNAPDVGKWYAISYKNLTKDSVQISGAAKVGGKTSCDTLEEAKEEFTIDNGYFAYYSECKKQ